MQQYIKTDRLTLRPWLETDAPALYRYASHPEVGPPAGWQPHGSEAESLDIIQHVFSAPEIYAVVLNATGEAIGCCGLVPDGARADAPFGPGDAEIGYWIGRPFWGMGLIPEAVRALAARARRELGKSRLWIAFYDGNDKSRRVAEKCGFAYHHTCRDTTPAEHFYVG